MNSRELRIRARLKNDFEHYALKCLKIRSKDGQVVDFKLNRAQKYVHRCLEKQLKRTGRVRALILKGRQQGCSTYVQARFFWKVTHRKGVRAFILTHLEEATRNLYRMVKRFYAHCPKLLRPNAATSNARALVFDKLDSGYRIGTAKSQGTGRSDTVQYFHGSEVAYWSHAETHIAGILQAVPDAKDTEVILESTSDGPQGMFYRMCQAAHAKQSPYQLIFVPWFWQSEYKSRVAKDFVPTGEELRLQKEFKLSRKQLAWRRNKIAELGGVWIFRREYPMTVQEAFLADTPGALWNRDMLDKNRVNTYPEMQRIVVAIDPAVSTGKHSDETGIVVAGLGADGHAYVLEDLSGTYSPQRWADRAIGAFAHWQADRIVAEANQGGQMVLHTLRTQDQDVPVKLVHATRGKVVRAEPIAALDERGLIHHAGYFADLEDQLCRFGPGLARGKSPDRVDARIWALTELMLGKKTSGPKVWRG